jgi:Putative phage serine protease XkdF
MKPIAKTLIVDVRKISDDLQQIFGWCSVVTKNGVPVEDLQGDIITVEALESAAYDYMLKSRDAGDMHLRKGVGRCIESIVFTEDKQRALGIDLGGTVGWWIGMQIDDPEVWKSVRAGSRPGFSIGGKAAAKEL